MQTQANTLNPLTSINRKQDYSGNGLSDSTLPERLKQYSLYKRVLNYVESPWAPHENDLPERSSLSSKGHSDLPFRSLPITPEEILTRKARLNYIRSRESREKISSWSSIYNHDVPIKNLPANFENFRILQLSDIHFEEANKVPINEINKLTAWLGKNQINPDMIVMTGDFINNHPDDLSPEAEHAIYQLLETSCNSYFVLGNHDFHGFRETEIGEKLSHLGAKNLTNAHGRIFIGNDSINLYGVDDAIFGNPKTPHVAHPNDVNLLLTHNLDAIRANFPNNFDLILSGHTHWGEVRFFKGTRIMGMWGYADLINKQDKHWDALTDRALSYIHPGLARHYVRIPGIRYAPGFTLLNLKRE